VVCADLDEVGTDGAYQIAEQFWEKQRGLICDQVQRVATEFHAAEIIVAGIGALLFARELGGTDLNTVLGPVAETLPAFSVKEIALREGYF
jgi:uncharacterized hydantoinase/oxoprolinase family protein